MTHQTNNCSPFLLIASCAGGMLNGGNNAFISVKATYFITSFVSLTQQNNLFLKYGF